MLAPRDLQIPLYVLTDRFDLLAIKLLKRAHDQMQVLPAKVIKEDEDLVID